MSERPIAMVTGAGSGVGREAARALARAGWRVVLAGRTESKLEETLKLIGEDAQTTEATEAALRVTDVTEPVEVEELVSWAMDRWGRIDAVANVAGDAPLGPIGEITAGRWRQCVDTNLSSVVYMTRAVWPVFTEQKSGTIVNVSSMASVDPFPGFAMYAAAKVGVNMFTRCTGKEGRKIGVKAVALVLGAVETQMLRQHFSQQVVPPEKAYSPEQIGQVIADCIVGEQAFKNGEAIQMPGPGS